MIPLLIVLLGQEPDSARVDRFIEAVERGDYQGRNRLFDDLRSGRVPYEAIASALVARPVGDRAARWLLRILIDTPQPSDGSVAARVLSVLCQMTPPHGEETLPFLEARHRWGDPTAARFLRNLAEDRHVPNAVRGAAVEILGEPDLAVSRLADESLPPEDRFEAAHLLARLGDRRSVPFLLGFEDPDLVEGGAERVAEALAYAAPLATEAWNRVRALASPGNPVRTRAILAALKRAAPNLARDFARAYLAAERASEDPDNDPECRNAALELSKEEPRRLLASVETAPAPGPSLQTGTEPAAKNRPGSADRPGPSSRWRTSLTIALFLAGLTTLVVLLRRRV